MNNFYLLSRDTSSQTTYSISWKLLSGHTLISTYKFSDIDILEYRRDLNRDTLTSDEKSEKIDNFGAGLERRYRTTIYFLQKCFESFRSHPQPVPFPEWKGYVCTLPDLPVSEIQNVIQTCLDYIKNCDSGAIYEYLSDIHSVPSNARFLYEEVIQGNRTEFYELSNTYFILEHTMTGIDCYKSSLPI